MLGKHQETCAWNRLVIVRTLGLALLAARALWPMPLFAQEPEDSAALETSGAERVFERAAAAIAEESPSLLQRGAWLYSVPIEVPPAPRDLKPGLAFVASHIYSNSLLGKGWYLRGLSSIERRSVSNGVPSLGDTDTFRLDGQPLVELGSGPSPQGLRRFRLERDDNRVFTYDVELDEWVAHRDGWTWRWGKYRTPPDGPLHSVAATQRSLDSIYLGSSGNSSSSILRPGDTLHSGRGVRWHLSLLRDPWGNQIHYDYETRCLPAKVGLELPPYPCMPRIASISYGPALILFNYQVRYDDSVTARDGVVRRNGWRLTGVKSFVLSGSGRRTPFSRYKLTYGPQQQSIVQSIDRLGADGSVRRLVSTQVNEQPVRFSGAVDIAGFGALDDLPAARPIRVNFDGDGFPDLMVISPAGLGYEVLGYHNVDSGALGFRVDSAMTTMLEEAFGHVDGSHDYVLTDIDGDGRTELLVPGFVYEWDPALEVFTSYAISFPVSPEPGSSPVNLRRDSFTDIDGDGLVDRILGLKSLWVRNSGQIPYFDGPELVLAVPHSRSIQDPFGQEILDLEDGCSSGGPYWHEDRPYGSRLGIGLFGWYDGFWNAHSRLADYNGDGIADIAYSFPSCASWDPAEGGMTLNNVFSRIYWGDGQGGFHRSALGAGPSFLENNSPVEVGDPEWEGTGTRPPGYYTYDNWTSWTLADLDADGVRDVIHRRDGEARLQVATYRGLEDGWPLLGDDLRLPEEVRALSTYVTAGNRPHLCWCRFLQSTLVADWSGDGFEDLLVMERGPFTSGIAYDVKIYKNLRRNPKGILTGLTNEWGGSIRLEYASSTLNGENPELPFPFQVVSAVTDHRGRSDFSYSGGRYERGEFHGFAEVEASYGSGLLVESQFSLSPQIRGNLVAKTERRRDGSIERFLYNRYYRTSNGSAVLDLVAPYFNPLRLSCDFEVGPPPNPQSGGPGVNEGELIERCQDFGAPVSPSTGGDLPLPFERGQIRRVDSMLYGWRKGTLTAYRNGDDLTLVGRRDDGRSELSGRSKRSASGVVPVGPPRSSTVPRWLTRRTPSTPAIRVLSAPPTALSKSLADLLQITVPSPVLSPPHSPGSAVEVRMFAKEQQFDSRQRRVTVIDYKNTDEPDDDLTLTLLYGPYEAGEIEGQELVGIENAEGPGVYRTFRLEDHAAFGAPSRIIEVGLGVAGRAQTRTKTYEYSPQGLVLTSTKQVSSNGDSVSDSLEYNDCGLPVRAVDTGGRELLLDYSSNCRFRRSRFQGGSIEQTRDGFGRIVFDQRGNGVSLVAPTLALFDDSIERSGKLPRYAKIQGELAELHYLDPWGRIIEELRCRALNADELSPKSQPSEVRCDPEESLYKVHQWAGDGSLRLATGLFREDEPPAFTLTFRDERGRPVYTYTPSRNYVGPEPSRRFTLSGSKDPVVTTRAYGVGVTTTTLGQGTVCTDRFDTLSRSKSCAGQLREAREFNARGQLVERTDPGGVKTSYAYDPFQRLAQETAHLAVESCTGTVTDPTIQFGYDDLDRLLFKRNPDGTLFRWERDGLGRLLSSTVEIAGSRTPLPLNRWEFEDSAPAGDPHHPGGRSMTSFDANGNRAVQYQDGFGFTYATETPGGLTHVRRDALGRVTHSTDLDGLETRFEYDIFGRVVEESIIVGAGSADYCGNSAGCRVATRMRYDGAGRLVELEDADGVVRRLGYSRAGDWAFETQGEWLMSAARRDPMGNPSWEFQGGVETTLAYDDLDRLVSECRGVVGKRCAQQFDYTYTPTDQLETISVGRWATTTLHYDPLGRVVGSSHPDGTRRKMIYGLTTPLCALIDEEGIETRFRHDALGRLTEVLPPGRSNPVRYEYDFDVSDEPFGLTGHLSRTSIIESDGSVSETYFDFANRPVLEKQPDKTWLRYEYSGSLLGHVSLVGSKGEPLEYVGFGYDELGRRRWEWGPVSPERFEAQGGEPVAGDYVQRSAYSPAGRLTRIDGPVSPADGAPLYSTRLEYRPDGFLQREVVVGVTETRYRYDTAYDFPRLLSTETGAAGKIPRITELAYDPSGLFLTELTTQGPVSGPMRVEKQVLKTMYGDHDRYGAPGEIATFDLSGGVRKLLHLTKIETDLMGRPESIFSRVDGTDLGTTRFKYYGNGQVRSVVAEWAGGLSYERDSNGRLVTLSATDRSGKPTEALAAIRGWNERGRPVDFELAGGASMKLTFDEMGRVIHHNIVAPSGKARVHTHDYDERGLLWRETIEAAGSHQATTYSYTDEGWLRSEVRRSGAAAPATDTYRYDAAGNRISLTRADGTVTTLEYGAIDGEGSTGSALLRVGNGKSWQEVEWDPYGGMIRDHRGYGLERDVLGQVTKIRDGAGDLVSELFRDHSGRPVKVRSRLGERIHSWAQATSTVFPLASRDEEGGVSVYAAFEQYLVGRVLNGDPRGAVTDMRGNLALAGNEFLTGVDAYGRSAPEDADGLPFVFGGQESVPDSPYLSAQQRLYDPDLGLFTSADPIGLAGGRDRFRYASNNPMSFLDPWGREAEDFLELEPGEPGSGGSVTAELVDLAEKNQTETRMGWEVVGQEIVHVGTGERYPVDRSVGLDITTSSGETIRITSVQFQSPSGQQGQVFFPHSEGAPNPEASQGGQVPGNDPPEPDTPEAPNPSDEGGKDSPSPGGPTGGSDAHPGMAGTGDTSGWNTDPMPENFRGTAEQLAGLLSDGYSVSNGGKLLRTPNGNVVIPGINDASNPLPHKVLLNLGADAVDDALNGGLAGLAAQGLGLWGGAGSPANDLLKASGFGYTPSEQPRETIAELSMGIALSAAGAAAGSVATSGGRAVLSRGRFVPGGRPSTALKGHSEFGGLGHISLDPGAGNWSPRQGVPFVNPGVGGPGRKLNCANCAIATDATLGGRPTVALPSSSRQPLSYLENQLGKSAVRVSGKTQIEDLMHKLGPGARGIVAASRRPGAGGHAFNVVVSPGGAVQFFDGSIGRAASFKGYARFRLIVTYP